MRRVRIKLYNLFFRIKRYTKSKYYKIRNHWHLEARGVIFSKDISINGKLLVGNVGTIVIGDGVVINSSSYPNPVGTSLTRIYTEKHDSIISIGSGTGISSSLIYAVDRIEIGKNCLIGAECKIMDTDFHAIRMDEKGVRGDGCSKSVKIGDNVFIGSGCIVLKGVSIGEGSVIGAGSVVTKNIPRYELWAGVPARFIKRLSDEC